MNFGHFAQAAAKIFTAHEQGTLSSDAPKRMANQVGQWVAHLSRNAALHWAPNLADPDICAFCEEDAIADCMACGDPSCIAHAHISHRAELICDECVGKLMEARAKKPRRKRRENPAKSPRQQVPPEVLQALAMLGIAPEATWEEINTAYREAVRVNHPDRFQGLQKAQAEIRLKAINGAFATLKAYFQKVA